MKKAVMYGAGGIGRGFIGAAFAKSGYEVCFIDVNEALVHALNSAGGYDVHLLDSESETVEHIAGVHACMGGTEEARDEIAHCDLMAMSVGARFFEAVAPEIAHGISKRAYAIDEPLDLLLAENQLDAASWMRELLNDRLEKHVRAWADENLGIVELAVGRMTPRARSEEDVLTVHAEPYSKIPADADAFRGGIPEIVGLVPASPFSFETRKKLFVHNMGHSYMAVLGHAQGHAYIDEAASDQSITAKVRGAMLESARSLGNAYGVPFETIEAEAEDLLRRFANPHLHDPVFRVAADPIRKLRPNDRFVGAAFYAAQNGVDPSMIIHAIAACMHYEDPRDPAACELQESLARHGTEHVMGQYLGVAPQTELGRRIRLAYEGYS